ncbi:hypothetical protein [Mitsuaria sp. 7]|uniref:hypothetical protein n=1 Tax=Mitsuaria sp. 7 TaxID=1658665 RepID=UPI0007DD5C4F|nr:hypothetical protein [Mitsuaria sp. 7]ANH68063.1 hypothetical protein ABE85_11610 [Mitsuaria sp. 7]
MTAVPARRARRGACAAGLVALLLAARAVAAPVDGPSLESPQTPQSLQLQSSTPGAAPLASEAASAPASVPVTVPVPVVPRRSLAVRLPAEPAPRFRAMTANDSARGEAGAMMYGPGLAGFFVALATHAAINDGVRTAAREREEAAANRVLEPYRPAMNGLRFADLLPQAVEASRISHRVRVVGADEVADEDMTLRFAPLFWMTQDHRGLLLEADVAIVKRGDTDPVWQRHVWLHAPPAPSTLSPQQAWADAEGIRLRDATTALLGQVLRLATEGAAQDGDPYAAGTEPERTLRYWEGLNKRFERGTVLRRQDCGWALVRNLRGDLMSVALVDGQSPAPTTVPGDACVAPAPTLAAAPAPAATTAAVNADPSPAKP